MPRSLALLVVLAAAVACARGLRWRRHRVGRGHRVRVEPGRRLRDLRDERRRQGRAPADAYARATRPRASPCSSRSILRGRPTRRRSRSSARARGRRDIYVMNADGTGTTGLTSGARRATRTRRGRPTAQSIAFARDGDIYVMGADGSNPQRISDINAQESDPAGHRTVTGSRTCGARRARPCRTSGSCIRTGRGGDALTKQAGRAFTPAWSPDSTRIVFSMNRDETLRALHDRRGRKGAAQRRADGGRQLRAVLVSRRDEDRLPGGRRDLHRSSSAAAT